MTIPRGSNSGQSTGPRLRSAVYRCSSCQPSTRRAQTRPQGKSVQHRTLLERQTTSPTRKSSLLGTDPRAARARFARSKIRPCNPSAVETTHRIQAFRKKRQNEKTGYLSKINTCQYTSTVLYICTVLQLNCCQCTAGCCFRKPASSPSGTAGGSSSPISRLQDSPVAVVGLPLCFVKNQPAARQPRAVSATELN
jgi:hypothetical protein